MTPAAGAALIPRMARRIKRDDEPLKWAEIGKRLYATRMALGVDKQEDFAARAGIASNTYNQWEKGRERPGLDYALALCRTYSLTLDWIYLGDISRLPHELALKISRAA